MWLFQIILNIIQVLIWNSHILNYLKISYSILMRNMLEPLWKNIINEYLKDKNL